MSTKKKPVPDAYTRGYIAGFNQVRRAVLTHLERKYVSDIDRPERGSSEANQLLGLATELAELMRSLDTRDNQS